MKDSLKARWIAVVGVVLVMVALLIGEAARYDEPGDFWTIAVPGVLTGVGTLALAGVTVLLSYQDRARDDQLRRAEWVRQDGLRTADHAREDAEREHERVRTNALLAEASMGARREQAASIAAWSPGRRQTVDRSSLLQRSVPGDQTITVSNPTAQPIYEVVIFQVFIQGAAPRTGEEWMAADLGTSRVDAFKVLPLVPPGRWTVDLAYLSPPMQGVLGVEIAFTDRAGAHWVRRSNGDLQPVETAAPELYGLDRPVSYATYVTEYVGPTI